MIVRKMRNIVM